MMKKLPFTHLSATDKAVLARFAKQMPAGATCLEVGSYLGASAIIIARSLPPGSRLFCVDTWQNDCMSEGARDTFAEFKANTSELSGIITPIRAASADAAASFEGQIDFLFIDGDHSYEGCKTDFEAWIPKVREGGTVVFHDVLWAEGVQRVIREMFLPIQAGRGGVEGNIYFGKVRKARDGAGESGGSALEAMAAVISSAQPHLPDVQVAYGPALRNGGMIWLEAGKTRVGIGQAAKGLDPASLQVLDAGAVGLVAGRHKALDVCQEEVIIYLDDDVSLPEGWKAKMLEPFEDPAVHFVGCRYLPDYEHQPPPWLKGLWGECDGFRMLGYLSLLDGGTEGRVYDPCYVWGLCFAVRRDTVLKLGGFHPDGYPWELRRYRGDGESALSLKAKLLGLKAFYQGGTHVMHKVRASRMTPEYFERRAFLQGISDSFTQIRRDGAPPAPPAKHWKDWLRPAKIFMERRRILRNPTAEGMRVLLQRAYTAGVAWHQAEVRDDPKLLEWVLKPDYFDYSLPEEAGEGGKVGTGEANGMGTERR